MTVLAILTTSLGPVGLAAAAVDPHKLWSPPGTPLPKTSSVAITTVGHAPDVTPHHPVPPAASAPSRKPVAAAAGTAELSAAGADTPARAGDLPVWLAPAASGPRKAVLAGKLTVRQTDSKAAQAAGIDGLLLQLTPTADTKGGPAEVALDPKALDAATGGAYSQRGHLVTLPACALTTPQVAACNVQTPVATHVDAATKRVVADIAIPSGTGTAPAGRSAMASPQAVQAASAPVLLGATSTASGGGGDFKASSLNPSSGWAAGGSSGGLNYSYGIQVPAALGGSAPTVSLSYNSSSVDGKTSATNTQASWIGDGWDYNPGFVERTYQTCDKHGIDGSGDRCWAGDNATMAFGSHSGQLVRDDKTGTWRLKNDDGTKIEFKTGASNGTNNGEYVKVTDTSGTAYYFGANYLPNAQGDMQTMGAPSQSVSTLPVYSPRSGDRCYDTGQGAASWCQMASRWALDYVIDPHGNLTTYTYHPETGYYARGGGQNNGSGTITAYTRANLLYQIAYGQRQDDQLKAGGSWQPAARITFTAEAERCTTDTGGDKSFSCAPSLRTTGNSSYWPDVPVDQECPAPGPNGPTLCAHYGPAFFTTKKLTSIATAVRSNNAWKDVDSYDLSQSFPAAVNETGQTGDVPSQRTLWLDSIVHTGKTATPNLPLPPVSFDYQMLPNRVDGVASSANGATFADIYRPRLHVIHNETGAVTIAEYNLPNCSRLKNVMPAAEDNNQMSCFPVKWTPPGAIPTDPPVLDWFNHYSVASLTTSDPTTINGGGFTPQQTAYTYSNPGWHRDDSEYTDTDYRTWGDFRGYATVTTVTGSGTDGPQGQSTTTYLQGLNGDKTTGADRVVSVKGVTDDNWLAGDVLESDTYDHAADSKLPAPVIVASTINRTLNPVVTATHAKTGDTSLSVPLIAQYSGTTLISTTRSRKADGTWRTNTTTANTDKDNNNRPITHLDQADGLPDLCTRTGYATGPDPQRTDLPSQNTTISGPDACTTAPTAANTVSDNQVLYDNLPFGQTGHTADPTSSQVLDSYDGSGHAHYTPQVKTAFDAYGRSVSSTQLTTTDAQNPGGATATTTYTPAAPGEQPATVKVSAPVPGAKDSWDTLTTFDVRRGTALTITDPNLKTVTEAYDALGRLTAVWGAGRPTSKVANQKFSYVLDQKQASPASVTSSSLLVDNGPGYYSQSVKILDGLGRSRQVQSTPATSGYTGRLISDSFYDSQGRTYKTNATWYNADAAPNGTLVIPNQTPSAGDNNIPSQNVTTFDGMSHAVASTFRSRGVDQWTTATAYPGVDRTDVTPPSGAWPTSTVTDARGRPTELWQYNKATPTGNPADATITRYTYTPGGQPSTRVDAVGNAWTYGYDLRGRQNTASDPDTGTTSQTYDSAGRLSTTTDARNKTLAFTYDLIGRKTGEYAGSVSPANQLAAWTYDTITGGKGKPTSSTRYVGGATGSSYSSTVSGYDNAYRPTGSTITIPGKEVGQTKPFTYTTTSAFNAVTGSLAITGLPAIGDLPAEILGYNYDDNGTLIGYGGAITYDLQTDYDAFGRPIRTTINPWATQVVATTVYDQGTGQVLHDYVDKQTAKLGQTQITDYTYNPAGQLTSITGIPDNNPSATDRQCFTYDSLGRLSTAWTDTGTITTPNPAQHKVLSQGACTDTTPTSGARAPLKTTVGGANPYWQDYGYDLTGNRKSLVQHDPSGDGTKDSTTTQTYPAPGSANTGSGTGGPHAMTGTNTQVNGGTTVSGASTYDAVGNTTALYLSKTGTTDLTWDGEDKLAGLTTADKITGIGGNCLDVANGSSATGATAQIYTCNGDGGQRFSTTGNHLNVFNKCLTAMGTTTGSAIQLQLCDGTPAQTWTGRADGTLLNAGSTKCLAVPGDVNVKGTKLALGDCATTVPTGQKWALPNTTTTYLYDADGNQLIRRDPGKTTINLGTDELTYDTTTKPPTLTGTRYYPMPNGMTTVRVGAAPALTVQIADHHGTNNLSINLTTSAETRRPTDPFGNPRGTQPAPGTWSGDKGFVGGTKDDTTGLTNLGAREYQPTTGRFLNPDPLLSAADPQQWNGYAYSNNNPVNLSDPSGQMRDCGESCGGPSGPSNVCYGTCAPPPSTDSDAAKKAAAEFLAKKLANSSALGHSLPDATFHIWQGSTHGYQGSQAFTMADALQYAMSGDTGWYDVCSALGRSAKECKSNPFTGDTDIGDAHAGEVAGVALLMAGTALAATPCMEGWAACASAAAEAEIAFVSGGSITLAAAGAGAGLAVDAAGAKMLFGDEIDKMLLGTDSRALGIGCSFTPETLVLMADGSKKPIGSITPGDQVEAADPSNGIDSGGHQVTATWKNHDNDLINLQVKPEGGPVQILHTTSKHPFWDATTRTWVPAGLLAHGHELTTPDGTPIQVIAVRPVAGAADMYNLTVDQLHTYYVLAGTTPVLVHNDGDGSGDVFYRGVKPGDQLSFAGRLGTDFKVDKVTGNVIPGRGISLTTQPDSLGKFGRVGVPVDASSIPSGLEIVQVGKPGHYELAVKSGVNMTPDEYQSKLGEVRPSAGCL